MLEERLGQIEQHVTEGEEHIARQRAIVAELTNAEQPSEEARARLDELLHLQAIHIADRDWLHAELARTLDSQKP